MLPEVWLPELGIFPWLPGSHADLPEFDPEFGTHVPFPQGWPQPSHHLQNIRPTWPGQCPCGTSPGGGKCFPQPLRGPIGTKPDTCGLNFPSITHEPNNPNRLAKFTSGFLKPKPAGKSALALLTKRTQGPFGAWWAVGVLRPERTHVCSDLGRRVMGLAVVGSVGRGVWGWGAEEGEYPTLPSAACLPGGSLPEGSPTETSGAQQSPGRESPSGHKTTISGGGRRGWDGTPAEAQQEAETAVNPHGTREGTRGRQLLIGPKYHPRQL